ncbi:MAG: hypothetical protein K2H18_04900, partial [Muribaculaceae bacterium]|nr:hypothetical protein [Muribaculaceae bacterium]
AYALIFIMALLVPLNGAGAEKVSSKKSKYNTSKKKGNKSSKKVRTIETAVTVPAKEEFPTKAFLEGLNRKEALPFSDVKGYNEYIKNLDFKKIKTCSIDYLYSDNMEKTTDKVLLEGLNLFELGKYNEAQKYFRGILDGYSKYTEQQRDFAFYQLYHIRRFGMTDPFYNGRPSKIDRSQGYFFSGNSYVSFGSFPTALLSKLILESDYRYPNINEKLWKKESYYEINELKNIIPNKDILNILLRASYPDSRETMFRHLSAGGLFDDNEFGRFMEQCAYSGKFISIDSLNLFSNKTEMPPFLEIRKGLAKDLSGDPVGAFKYFCKLSKQMPKDEIDFRKYAEYQCWHLLTYGKTDLYYDGRPSKMERIDNFEVYWNKN